MIYLQFIAIRFRSENWDLVDAWFAAQVRRRQGRYFRKLNRRFRPSIVARIAAWIGGKGQP